MLFCTGAMSAWQARNHDRQHQALMDVSRADPLTGCLNRRGFEERAVAEIASATRRAHQGAVLVLDVDHFKEVNDRHGHGAGDELLRWVVATMQSLLRPVRRDRAHRRRRVRGPGRRHRAGRRAGDVGADGGGAAPRQPCSIGVATFPMDGIELEELMRPADTRLYASRDGRPRAGTTTVDERLSWAATLAHAVDVRMSAEHEHSRAVADWAVEIAAALGWKAEMLGTLRIAAMLHDVGKVTVPDRILGKPGPLTAEELETVKGHSVAGAELVARVEGLVDDRALDPPRPRALRRVGLPGRSRRRGDPAGLADHARCRRVRRDHEQRAPTGRPARSSTPATSCGAGAGSQFDPACVERDARSARRRIRRRRWRRAAPDRRARGAQPAAAAR